MYTLYFNSLGTKVILFLISLISSTPLLEAASISIISVHSLFITDKQFLQELQESPSFKLMQFTVLANNLAIDVFPVRSIFPI